MPPSIRNSALLKGKNDPVSRNQRIELAKKEVQEISQSVIGVADS
jgi:hypothetical protein